MSIVYGKSEEFNDLVKEGLVLVDFYADWCGPCKMLAPMLDQLSSEMPEVKIVKINIDEERALAENYNVMSIPTLHLFKDGNIVSTKQGFQAKDMLVSWVGENK